MVTLVGHGNRLVMLVKMTTASAASAQDKRGAMLSCISEPVL